MSRLLHATLTYRSGHSQKNAVIDKLSTFYDSLHFSSLTEFTANEGDYFAVEVDTPKVPFFMVEETSQAAVNRCWEWFFSGSVDQPQPLVFTGTDGKPHTVIASGPGAAGLYDDGAHPGHTNQPSYNPSGPKTYLIFRVKKAATGQPPNKVASLQSVRNG